MRRSLLFVPGNNPGMVQNASLFDADCIIFDLEDAVSVSEKDSARLLIKYYLEDNVDIAAEVAIRINSLDSSFFAQDFAMLVGLIDTIVVPKATVADLHTLDELCTAFENKETKKIKFIPIIESAKSLLQVEEIAQVNRVSGILFGAEDFSTDVDIQRTKLGDEIAYPRSRIAIAAKAYKLDAIDTPCTDFTDDAILIEDCKRAKSFAMNAKTCIHPNQIPIVNRMFAPTDVEIAYAQSVIAEAKKHIGIGAFNLDGKMIDKPIITRCENIIKKAKKYGLIDDEK